MLLILEYLCSSALYVCRMLSMLPQCRRMMEKTPVIIFLRTIKHA